MLCSSTSFAFCCFVLQLFPIIAHLHVINCLNAIISLKGSFRHKLQYVFCDDFIVLRSFSLLFFPLISFITGKRQRLTAQSSDEEEDNGEDDVIHSAASIEHEISISDLGWSLNQAKSCQSHCRFRCVHVYCSLCSASINRPA